MDRKDVFVSFLLLVIMMLVIALGFAMGHVKIVSHQRDILSDCIRSSMDMGDSIVSRNADFYLNVIGTDTTRLKEWSYCY